MVPLLQVNNLEIAFIEEQEQIIGTDKIDFSVNSSEVLAIVGESGCGKSITALSIMGLLGKGIHVIDGEILFHGKDLLQMKEKDLDRIRGKELSMVFQDAMNSLNPVLTIGNQLRETIRVHLNYDKKRAEEYAEELLLKVGLPDPKSTLKKYPHMLSGGMRQRAMIAMALACRPKLIIADEPTTALDVTIQLQIMTLLKELREEFQMSIILITHDIGLVAELADRVLVMYAGQFVEESSVGSLFKNPAHPYTVALLESVPGIYDDKEKKLVSIPGIVPERYDTITGCRFKERCSYATEICKKRQEYIEVESGHRVRCHLANERKEKVV